MSSPIIRLKQFIALFLFCAVSTTFANDNTDSLVKGFANYQAGRVENLVLDEFLYDLANQKYLKLFFPLTAKNIQTFDGISGKRLIPELKVYFEKDLGQLRILSTCIQDKIKKNIDLHSIAISNKKSVPDSIKILDLLVDLKKGYIKVIEFIDRANCNNEETDFKKDSDSPLKDSNKTPTVNSTIDNANQANPEPSEKSIEGTTKDKKYNMANTADFPASTIFENLYVSHASEIKSLDDLDRFIKLSLSEKEILFVSKNSEPEKGVSMQDLLDAIESANEINSCREEKNYALCLHHLSMIFEALGYQVRDRKAFQKFKSASFFLGSLSDAIDKDNINSSNSSNNGSSNSNSNSSSSSSKTGGGSKLGGSAVAGVISDYVNEDEAYKNKRNSVALYTHVKGKHNDYRCTFFIVCHDTWFLGSYYGLSTGKLDENFDGSKHQVYRAFGPVGVEFKLFSGPILGSKPTIVTIMYAPIDIGVYVTNELKSEKYDVSIEDIRTRSLFLSFTPTNSPRSFQVGVQNSVLIDNGNRARMIFFAFSFDLPLFTIW